MLKWRPQAFLQGYLTNDVKQSIFHKHYIWDLLKWPKQIEETWNFCQKRYQHFDNAIYIFYYKASHLYFLNLFM